MNEVQREELRKWLRERLDSVSRIDRLEAPWWNPVAVAIEVGATRKAHAVLSEAFGDVAGFSARDGGKRDPRDSYDVGD